MIVSDMLGIDALTDAGGDSVPFLYEQLKQDMQFDPQLPPQPELLEYPHPWLMEDLVQHLAIHITQELGYFSPDSAIRVARKQAELLWDEGVRYDVGRVAQAAAVDFADAQGGGVAVSGGPEDGDAVGEGEQGQGGKAAKHKNNRRPSKVSGGSGSGAAGK